MKIAMIGTGYVGLCSGVGFALKGHDVICIARNEDKIKNINNGISPIYESGISDYLKEVLGKRKLRASSDLKGAIKDSDISFICVGTPPRKDGGIDLSDLEKVSRDIGSALKETESYHVVVVKSTVVPGTTERAVIPNLEEYSGKGAGQDFGVCMNPEFLREGSAIEDFVKADRVVIGELDKKSGNVLEAAYSNFGSPILRVDLKTAEMIKYASNSFLATKISFVNEVGNICKKMGIDVYNVMKGVAMDHRISPYFLRAGLGYGGSCFPKDVSALVSRSKSIGYEPRLLDEVMSLNNRQRMRVVDQLSSRLGGLKGKRVSLLGLAFKPGTDDVRESPALDIISELKRKGSELRVYDPQAMENVKKLHPDITYCNSKEDALKDSDACLIITDWDEFKSLTDNEFGLMRGNVIIEGRRVLNPEKVKNFEGIAW